MLVRRSIVGAVLLAAAFAVAVGGPGCNTSILAGERMCGKYPGLPWGCGCPDDYCAKPMPPAYCVAACQPDCYQPKPMPPMPCIPCGCSTPYCPRPMPNWPCFNGPKMKCVPYCECQGGAVSEGS